MPTMCISGHVFAKTGPNITKLSGANLIVSGSQVAVDAWIEEAESMVCNMAKKDLVAAFETMSAPKRNILQDIVSSQAAIIAIQANMEGWNRVEAEDKINVLRDGVLRGLSMIRDVKNREWFYGS